MKTFLINLPHHATRREFVLSQVKNIPSIDLEIIEAIDGKSMSNEQYESLTDKEMTVGIIGRPLAKTEVACVQSHAKVYKQIVDRNIPYALVLEDDVIIPSDVDVDSLYQRAISDDIVMLGITSNDQTLHNGPPRYTKRPSHFSVWGFFAYIVTYHAALKLLNLFSEKILFPADATKEIGLRTGLTCGMFLPSIVTVNYTLGSYIGPERSEMRKLELPKGKVK